MTSTTVRAFDELSEAERDGIAFPQRATPFVVVRRESVVHCLAEFNRLSPKATIHFAMKANPLTEILKVVQENGGGFEVASAFELRSLQRLGVAPGRIIYGTSVKPAAHIAEVFRYGVDKFAFDSLPELEKIARGAPGARVFVRVSVDDEGSVFRFSEKFGVERDQILPLLERAVTLGLVPYGISFHVGSQASSADAWATALRRLRPVFAALARASIPLKVINIGGGFPCQYLSAQAVPPLAEIARELSSELEFLPSDLALIIEPGRAIVAESMSLVTSVIARVERCGRSWLFLDAGVYNGLFEALTCQGSTRYRVTTTETRNQSVQKCFHLAGPTGDGLDVVGRDVLLPSEVGVDDRLIFHKVGAYTVGMCGDFNGFPAPTIYMA